MVPVGGVIGDIIVCLYVKLSENQIIMWAT